jgi:hypothetical protein
MPAKFLIPYTYLCYSLERFVNIRVQDFDLSSLSILRPFFLHFIKLYDKSGLEHAAGKSAFSSTLLLH